MPRTPAPRRARISALAAAVLIWCAGASAADYAEREDVRAYVADIVQEHGFDEEALLALLGEAQRKEAVLNAISRPAERTRPWHEYRDIFLTRARVADGVAFWRENEAALANANQAYGVAPEFIVAIIGVETSYGRVTGSYRVLDALATLAFDYPPRGRFFLGELTQFLLLVQEERRDPLSLNGSYAGAMGFGQFIPSSYRAYAVDFDGDGRRDIWSNVTDAVGSVANYFDRHGWRGGGPVALRVEVEGAEAEAAANAGLAPNYDVAELKALGVRVEGVPDDAKAALFQMEATDGHEYWLGLHNFYVITRYNHSAMYALAVTQLAGLLREAHGNGASWLSLRFGEVLGEER